MNKKWIFIKYADNWADEMDIEGTRLMTEADWDKMQKGFAKRDYPYEMGIGTNEEVEFTSAEDVMSKLTVYPLTEEEMDVLVRLDLDDVGFFPERVAEIEDAGWCETSKWEWNEELREFIPKNQIPMDVSNLGII